MPTEVSGPAEIKETVSHSLPLFAVRIIEYRAFLDRCNKSDALLALIVAGAKALQQQTPDDERRTA